MKSDRKGCEIVYNIWENIIFYKNKIKKICILSVIKLCLNKTKGLSIAVILKTNKKQYTKQSLYTLSSNYHDCVQSIGNKFIIVKQINLSLASENTIQVILLNAFGFLEWSNKQIKNKSF